MSHAKEILDRMSLILGATTYQELATRLGVSKSTVGNWYHRNSVPFEECVKLAEEQGISLDWLLLGRGEPVWSPAATKRSRLGEGEGQSGVGGGVEARAPEASKVSSESSLGALWLVLEQIALSPRPISEMEIMEKVGFLLEEVKRLCSILRRRRLISHTGEGWVVFGTPIIRVDTEEEANVFSTLVLTEFRERVLPRAASSGGAVAIAEVKIKSEQPGEAAMQAIHRALAELEQPDGVPLRMVVGMTLAIKD